MATSLTVTYAFDDYLLGKISEFVNDTETAQAALRRSKNYQNIWSKDLHIFCPRSVSGEMQCPDSPIGPEAWQTFIEGDALHWSWFVPHDVEGLIALYNSPQEFDATLESFMVNHIPYHEKFGAAVPNPYFWAGNEHDFLAPWMFNFGPDCTKTQYWTRLLTKMHYSNTPHGIPGNDDYGSMSTWIMFASLGFYPQAGFSTFLIGSPRVQSATIALKHWNGLSSNLQVVTYNNSEDNVFVEKLLVNGQVWTSPFISRSVLANPEGTKLEFYMQAKQASGLCPVA